MKCADASMGEWGSHATSPPPPPPYGGPVKIHGASSKPMQVKEGTDAITLRPRIQSTKIININRRKMKNGEGGRRRRNNNDAFNFGSIFSFYFPYFKLLCKFVCA
jgi:hypothetical protein